MTEAITVLLADDHPVVREGLRTMLQTTPDIKVTAEAADGLEALQMVAQYQPQIVLMDLRMPNLDGLEATRRIKQEFPATSVIVLTIYDNEAYMVDAIKAGAGGYLLKDTSKDLLIHTIRAVNSGGMLIKTSLLREAMTSLTDFEPGRGQDRSTKLDKLSSREQEVLKLVAQGHTNKKIGALLNITDETVKKHVQSIIAKMGVSDRTQAAVRAVQRGLVP